MKKIHLVLLLVIVLLLTGAVWFFEKDNREEVNVPALDTSTWKTYFDAEGVFEFKYPPHLFVVEGNLKGRTIQLEQANTTPEEDRDPLYAYNPVSKLLISVGDYTLTPEGLVRDGVLEGEERKHVFFDFAGEKAVRIARCVPYFQPEGIPCVIPTTDSEVLAQGTLVRFSHGGKTYDIFVYESEDLELFNTVLSTFHFNT